MADHNLLEYRICTRLIYRAISGPFTVSVFDGLGWPVRHCRDTAQILKAMFSADMDKLRFRTMLGKFVGDVVLQYGAGEDVISDWTDNRSINQLVQEVQRDCVTA